MITCASLEKSLIQRVHSLFEQRKEPEETSGLILDNVISSSKNFFNRVFENAKKLAENISFFIEIINSESGSSPSSMLANDKQRLLAKCYTLLDKINSAQSEEIIETLDPMDQDNFAKKFEHSIAQLSISYLRLILPLQRIKNILRPQKEIEQISRQQASIIAFNQLLHEKVCIPATLCSFLLHFSYKI